MERNQYSNWNCSFISFYEFIDPKYFGNNKYKKKCAYLDGMAAIHKLNEIQESFLLKFVLFFHHNNCLSSVNSACYRISICP